MSRSTTKYTNNAKTTLSANILSGDTTLPVNSSVGFPTISPSSDEVFFVTLDDGVNIEIVKVTGVSGNTFVNCVRAQEGTSAHAFSSTTSVENRLTAGNVTAFARLQDRLRDVSSIDNLESPTTSDGNSALLATTDAIGSTIVATVNGTKWKFVNYPEIIKSALVGGGSSTTSILATGIGSILIDTTAKMYLLQITSGTNIGVCRFISTISANSFSWTTALPTTCANGDTYEIYRCVSAFKAPLGGNSDRIFFENDQNVWSDYTIPAGRNASSTGPVTINVGVNVTVPVGSAWTVV